MRLRLVSIALASIVTTLGRRMLGRGPKRPTWTVKMEILVGMLQRSGRHMAALDPPRTRAFQDAMARFNGVKLACTRTRTSVAGVPCEWFVPPALGRREAAPGEHHLVYYHGGGYEGGSPTTHADLLCYLAHETGWPLLAVDYRLSPEHPHPAAQDDVLAVTRARLAEGPLVIAGDSAGGALVLWVLMALRDARAAGSKEAQPLRGVALSPWIDLAREGGSIDTHVPFDWATPAELRRWRAHHLGTNDPRLPAASPLYGDLTGLPPVLVEVGTAELLLDQVRDLHRALAAAGNAGPYVELPDQVHNSYMLATMDKAHRADIVRVATFITTGRVP